MTVQSGQLQSQLSQASLLSSPVSLKKGGKTVMRPNATSWVLTCRPCTTPLSSLCRSSPAAESWTTPPVWKNCTKIKCVWSLFQSSLPIPPPPDHRLLLSPVVPDTFDQTFVSASTSVFVDFKERLEVVRYRWSV